MGRLRFVGILIMPSFASTVLCVMGSALVMAAAALSYNAKTGFLYDLLLGPGSSIGLLKSGQDTLDTIFQTTFGNALLNKIIFFAFWCFVGLVVYILISGAGKTTLAISDVTHQLQYFNVRKKQFEEQLGLRLMVGAIALLGLFIYGVFFMRMLFPFALLCGQIGVGDISSINGWLYILAGFTVLTLSFHLIIVALRLLLLRPRLFGGSQDIIEDEIAHTQHGL